MTSLADRTIAALRSTHDDLVATVRDLSSEQLAGPSAASEWSLTQVLSHLGSGAEITLAGLRAVVDGAPAPAEDFAESVWARWDASSPDEQATGFATHDAALVETFEALAPDERADLSIDVGFLPAPLPLSTFAGMRLSEAALHSWDVRAGLDPTATLHPDVAAALVEHWAGGLGFLLTFAGRADTLTAPTRVRIGSSPWLVSVKEAVTLGSSPAAGDQAAGEGATATFAGELEAAVRLIAGRLGASYTPDGVHVTGNVSLADLRRVFPGY